MQLMRLPVLCAVLATLCVAGTLHAQTPFSDHLVGDLGAAVYATSTPDRRQSTPAKLLPFAYADYGRYFVRVDTFGIKTLPIGAGYLEVVARASLEGVHSKIGADRSNQRNPLPVGIGSFQETSYGGFFLYAFFDPRSGGTLLEATYAAEYKVRNWSFYPQAGIERRSQKYVRRLYGVTGDNAAASNLVAYDPGAANTPALSMAADVPLYGPLVINLQLRRAWNGRTIRDSPLSGGRREDSGFIALSYAFK